MFKKKKRLKDQGFEKERGRNGKQNKKLTFKKIK